MTETKLNVKPDGNQNNPNEDSTPYQETMDDDEFLSVAKKFLERNLEAYKELAK